MARQKPIASVSTHAGGCVDKKISYPHLRRVGVSNPLSYPHYGDKSVYNVGITQYVPKVGCVFAGNVVSGHAMSKYQ